MAGLKPANFTLGIGMMTPVAFLCAIPWLKHQPDFVVYLSAGIAAAITIGAGIWLAILQDRQADEWHRSASRFSSQWGWIIGAGIVSLLLAVPWVHDLIVGIAAGFGDSGVPDRETILLTFTFGFLSVVFMQALCTSLFSIVWRHRMSRPE